MTLPIMLPIPGRSGLSIIATPISWPVIRAADSSMVPSAINIDGQSAPVALLTSVDQMARKALSDEMPGIIARSSVRAITRGVAQKAIDDNAGSMGAFGSLLSLAAKVGTVVTEVADERTWRTLPGFFSVARVKLPVGAHTISLLSGAGQLTREVKLSGNYAVVTMRTSGPSLYLAQTPFDEQKAALGLAAPDTPPAKVAKGGKKAAPNNAAKAAAAAKEKALASAAAKKKAIVPVSASANE